MLLFVAIGPLLPNRWWERNNQYLVALLGGIVVWMECFLFRTPEHMWHAAVEYFAFLSLIGSLFVVTGGIVIRIEGGATPAKNVLLLLVGAILANVMGTTGASMLLIRPFLHLNRRRLRPYLVVFFIFVVSNIGGALTPIGDPPLFLGYLSGIPFFWPLRNLWPVWALEVGLLLFVFAILDSRHRSEEPAPEESASTRVVILGAHNFLFLGVILAAAFLATPIRELLMIAAAVVSFHVTPEAIRREHEFTFHPIVEVATLFAGIFATMAPALAWLKENARLLGVGTPGSFFWATGSLSAVLDNAPTYLCFLATALGYTHQDVSGILNTTPILVRAISVGAVFFGACTYIGNGPNFMVKCIAERANVRCPSFVGYILRYTVPVLLPTFALVWALFFC